MFSYALVLGLFILGLLPSPVLILAHCAGVAHCLMVSTADCKIPEGMYVLCPSSATPVSRAVLTHALFDQCSNREWCKFSEKKPHKYKSNHVSSCPTPLILIRMMQSNFFMANQAFHGLAPSYLALSFWFLKHIELILTPGPLPLLGPPTGASSPEMCL
jgi:hypothetical protein